MSQILSSFCPVIQAKMGHAPPIVDVRTGVRLVDCGREGIDSLRPEAHLLEQVSHPCGMRLLRAVVPYGHGCHVVLRRDPTMACSHVTANSILPVRSLKPDDFIVGAGGGFPPPHLECCEGVRPDPNQVSRKVGEPGFKNLKSPPKWKRSRFNPADLVEPGVIGGEHQRELCVRYRRLTLFDRLVRTCTAIKIFRLARIELDRFIVGNDSVLVLIKSFLNKAETVPAGGIPRVLLCGTT